MQYIKNIIIKLFEKTKINNIMILLYKYKRQNKGKIVLFKFMLKTIFNFYIPNKKYEKGKQIIKVLNKAKIDVNEKYNFIYSIDVFKSVPKKNRVIDNLTIDYSKFLDNSLEDFKNKANLLEESAYKNNQKDVIYAIEKYIDRECETIKKSNRKDKEKIIKYLINIKEKKANSFEESIQRILFYNQILWQLGHGLNGFGRLDKILEKSYKKDIEENNLTKDDAKDMIKDMYYILHEKFWFKSNMIMGDTGQIIILGGKEADNSYFYNELTYMFIEVLKEIKLPDPKVFLRVSDKTPRDLIALSLECIKTGIGCPLFSNDDVVIPKLIEFGYDKEDAYNYVTSACWEPLIVGKSVEQNNIESFVYIEPFNDMLQKEDLTMLDTYNKFIEKYKEYLKRYILDFIKIINDINWEEAPFLSMITENCNENLMDVAYGGAKYNNYGVTSVSLGNIVNSIYNIKKYVFEEKKYSLEELNKIRKNNFEGNEKIENELKLQNCRYGTDNEDIINISNEITEFVSNIFNTKTNKFEDKFKYGLSAPTYIIKSENALASFDGRKNGEPYIVHISSDKASVAYTELIQFAAKLNYGDNRFNGNVIDFMITPSFIEKNFEKMVDFIILSVSLGFFQMQMNVISSEILIKAKNNPKEYSNLIVRVWGFSAYFNDLPDSYKDLLIERALKNEGKSI